MAEAAIMLRPANLVGTAAREDALAKLEAYALQIETSRQRRNANRLVKRSLAAFRQGDFAKAAKFALKAVQEDDTHPKACHLLGMAMERMGHMRKALAMYERALALDPDDKDLMLDLGLTASNLKMVDTAEKLFRHYIAVCPDSPLGYNNLAGLLCKNNRMDEGIELVRHAIFRMPQHSILWNTLATALAEDGRCEESLVFYQEGLRLDPDFPRAWHNLGYAFAHLGRLEEAMDCYAKAMDRAITEADRLETTHSRSLCLLGMGSLDEGLRDYEVRYHKHFRAYVQYMSKSPRWKGEPLDGKKILAISEQGLGDEIMFASVLPDMARAVGKNGKLQVAVDQRLIGLFQRSFPDAEIGTYADRRYTDKDGIAHDLRFIPFAEKEAPDFHIPMGNALRFFRKDLSEFPHAAFLAPDPARVAEYREKLKSFGDTRFVGICWRSMLLAGKRHKYYSALDMWGPILKTPGITFVNLQYGDCAAELERARAQHGISINIIEGLDLKNDIDGAAALSAALDLVISAPTAAAATAASVGTDVWFLTAGRTWPQLGTDHYPWYPKTRVFCPEKFADWNTVIAQAAGALAQFAQK